MENETIICIANTSWFGNYAKSTVQIMERLAHKNRVLFVEYPYTIKDVYSSIRGKQNAPVKRMLGIDNRLQKIICSSGAEVYNLVLPPGLPLFFLKNEIIFNLLFPINLMIYRIALKRVMRKLSIVKPIVVTAFNPIYGNGLLGKLNEKKHIYYCYDGVESTFFGKRIFSIENMFAKNVDAIITSSDFLWQEKLKLNSACFVVKNGVDFQHFSFFAKTKVCDRVRKKIGFIGSLDPRFDIDTVEFAIRNLPQYDFEFTGDMRNNTLKSRLSVFPNVSFFDPIPPNDVPALLATYDVGMIPYIVNEVNRNIYPLKINEYLAVGVPLVMTNFALLPEFNGLVSVAKSNEEFIQLLHKELLSDNDEKIKERILFAKNNSWEERTNDFAKVCAVNLSN